jgi:starch synthase
MSKPKLLICTPEIIDLKVGEGNLLSKGINFSNGGMAPVNSQYIVGLIKEGTFEVSAAIPKWESSLRELNELTTREIKTIESSLPNNFYPISHPSFNKVQIKGSNTLMWSETSRFGPIDRSLAFCSGIVNTVLPRVNPDILLISDWMTGIVGPVAKAMNIGVVIMGHNPLYTNLVSFDEVISKGVELRDLDSSYLPSKWIYWDNGMIELMASGINSSDDFLTVSPSYLERLLGDTFYNQAPKVIDVIRNKKNSPHPDGRLRVHGYLNPSEKDYSYLLESLNSITKL